MKTRLSQNTSTLRKRIAALTRLVGFWKYRARRAEEKCIELMRQVEGCRCNGP